MKQYTYSFYARVVEKRLQLPNNKGYFAKWLNRWDILRGRYKMVDYTHWVRKSIAFKASDSEAKDIIKAIEDKHAPLFLLIHGKYNVTDMGQTAITAALNDTNTCMHQLEHSSYNVGTNYIKNSSNDNI